MGHRCAMPKNVRSLSITLTITAHEKVYGADNSLARPSRCLEALYVVAVEYSLGFFERNFRFGMLVDFVSNDDLLDVLPVVDRVD